MFRSRATRSAADRRADGLQRESRGLHGARQDHHAAQGSDRFGDPDPLPGHAAGRDGDHRSRKPGSNRGTRGRARRSSARRSRRWRSRRARSRRSTSAPASASGCRSHCSENVVSNAERRALIAGESVVVPRITDIYAALPGHHRKVRARVRRRAARRRQRRARRHSRGGRQRLHRLLSERRHPPGGRVVRSRAAICRSTTRCAAAELLTRTGDVQGLRELAAQAGIRGPRVRRR